MARAELVNMAPPLSHPFLPDGNDPAEGEGPAPLKHLLEAAQLRDDDI